MSAIPETIGDKLTARAPGRHCLTGNEAIVRGALEAGVGFVSGYPGTPASEIGDIFRDVSPDSGIQFEDSINEKVALETAFTASLLGVRALAAMKHLGLAYAGDPLGTIPYVGVNGGCVIVSGGDPGLLVSPNEQDQRYVARMIHVPVFDPAGPQEALEMSRFAFSLSEQTSLPVLLRTTIQVNFARGIVTTGELPESRPRRAYRKSPREHVPIPANARRMRKALAERILRAEGILAGSSFYPRFGKGKFGILTCGAPLNYVIDAVEELGYREDTQVLYLGCVYPVPGQVLESFLRDVESVLVVEELLPFAEESLKVKAQETGFAGPIFGKTTGHLPQLFALDPDSVRRAIRSFVGGTPVLPKSRSGSEPASPDTARGNELLSPRPPVLCAGCSHRSAFLAVKLVLGDESIYCNDIGCYTLGYGEPLESADMLLCMGSSITMASTASRLGYKNAVAYIGDSTFFHSGLPALANAVRKDDDIIVVVMDNQTVAMTGHQVSYSVTGSQGDRAMSIEEVARSLGAKVRVVNPDELGDIVPIVSEIAADSGVRVLVTQEICPLVAFRTGRLKKDKVYRIDRSRCRHCGHEGKSLYCAMPVPDGYQRTMARSRVLAVAEEEGHGGRLPEGACSALGTHDGAPCARACPVNICIQGYVGRVAAGEYAEALAMIRLRNPLPVISSYVCHRPCEDACVKAATGAPVAVNRVKEFLVGWEKERGDQGDVEVGEKPTPGPRVAVIGAGPAGLACAADLVDRGYEAVVFDAHDKPGGMLELGIPAYRLPRDMLAHEIEAIRRRGVSFVTGWKLGGDNSIDGLMNDGFEAVCVAIGAHQPAGAGRIDIDDEGARRTRHALDFLKDANAGRIESIAGNVLVVGGGDCAIDAVRTSVRLAAESVTVLYRRGFDEMPARDEEIDGALAEGARFVCHGDPIRVECKGQDAAVVTVQKTRPGAADKSGRPRPEPIPGEFFELHADEILLAISEVPGNSDAFKAAGMTVGPDGTVTIDPETCATSREAVFAAGDVAGTPRTVLDAIASGKRAAFGIDTYLSRGEREVATLDFLKPVAVDAGTSRADGVAHVAGVRRASIYRESVAYESASGSYTALERAAHERPEGFDRSLAPIGEAEARTAAAACLICGACGECSVCLDMFGCPAMHVHEGKVRIDEELCTGCGVCALFCPNHAIVEVAST